MKKRQLTVRLGGRGSRTIPFADPSTNYFYGTVMPTLAASFANDTKYGQWASMGGASFSGASYGAQKTLVQQLSVTSKTVSNVAKGMGVAGGVLTMASDAVGMYNYYRYGALSPNAVSPYQTAVDAFATHIGITGGWPGAVASSVYFAVSPGLWFIPGSITNNPSPVDAMYVAPRNP